jgi:hypothetical protein
LRLSLGFDVPPLSPQAREVCNKTRPEAEHQGADQTQHSHLNKPATDNEEKQRES